MVKYKLITPDGVVFDLTPPLYEVHFQIPDGMGIPPIQHNSQQVYLQPGAQLKNINILPRQFALNLQLNAATRALLHTLRSDLWQKLRWNRTLVTNPPDPFVLRYEVDGRAADLFCHYLSDNELNIKDTDAAQDVVVQLVAYDPLWYKAQTITQYGESARLKSVNMVSQLSLSVSDIVAKVGGSWLNFAGGVSSGTIIYAIAKAPDGTIYAGGAFTNIGGVAANNIAKWNGTTWSALGSGTNQPVRAIVIAPNGDVYVGGEFTLAGGVANTSGIAKWDGANWSALGTGTTGGNVHSLAKDNSGNIFAGGSFTSAGGVANTLRIARWDGTAWFALSTGADNTIQILAFALPNTLYVGGDFANIGGIACTRIAKWDGTTFSALSTGVNGRCWTISIDALGNVYTGGEFTLAGGISGTNRIAKWNGISWIPLAGGANGDTYSSAIDGQGIVYVGGSFTSIGGVTIADRIAKWNGSSWSQLDIDFPGTPSIRVILSNGDGLYFGFDTGGTAIISAPTTLAALSGDIESFPIFTITGPGLLQWIEQSDVNKIISLNIQLQAGETATINLMHGQKTFSSDVRGNLLPYSSLLPISDFASWALVPEPIAPNGNNSIRLLMTGTLFTEFNDGSNQLSAYNNITGVTPSNTDGGGKMYVSIIADGGGFFHVELYRGSARSAAVLVGHTATYNTVGAKTILPDNSSGLGGTVTVDAVTAADADIYVYFATAKVQYREAFLSADGIVGE